MILLAEEATGATGGLGLPLLLTIISVVSAGVATFCTKMFADERKRSADERKLHEQRRDAERQQHDQEREAERKLAKEERDADRKQRELQLVTHSQTVNQMADKMTGAMSDMNDKWAQEVSATREVMGATNQILDRNNQALESFDSTQNRMNQLLEKMNGHK